MAPAVNARPYRDFLTTSLHRRFAKASFYTLFLCWVIAIWMGDWNSLFWTWFPLSAVGLRTIALYIPAFMVFMIRVSQWHVGQRNTVTPNQVFNRLATKKSTFLTFALYSFSAWVYSEIYIWTQSQHGRLQFTVDQGRFTERIKLNERPVYLRFMFVILGCIQTIVHLWADYDQIRIPVKRTEQTGKTNILQLMRANLVLMFSRSIILAASAFPIATVLYYLVGRDPLWRLHFFLVQFFVSLSRNAKPSGVAPFMSLAVIYLIEGTLVTFLWQYTNFIFSSYINREPLKKELPITNDSKDPNGSLLNGLKSKKDAVKSTAFWELAIITERFPDRRKTIYAEPDRVKGPTHTQIINICLAELGEIHKRVDAAMNPDRSTQEPGKSSAPAETQLVRQIAQPLKEGQILGPKAVPQSRWEKVGAVTGEIARNNSSSQNVQNSYAKEYLKKGQEKASHGVRQAESWWDVHRNRLAASPVGWPFRQSLPRTANVVVAGAFYSRQATIFNAITALANLAVHSLSEDIYGSFHNEVPEIIRTLTQAIKDIDAYMNVIQIHWTDFETLTKPEAERKKVKEVEEITAELKDGLEKIVRAFTEYLPGMKISSEEIREAKRLVAKGPEVAQLR
ncbi:hypothetical protein BU24DRAFT_244152 [Aaosphaeria arxii CBS 175.79]|uniref:Nucleoporin protein Ndc1-Nup n=1 Tax=Aaosphaeria arxii CBS 175.79 TaxID=1450172 RepID=A0A6A5XLL1_9PLEO|nr:uncharacterized protein BU24DRAFT_244152 [Aaosphaeria arxii CBS 175.79]KAF2013697.1 hypothetical protein BU24DRAFT_244152 [Aaosphaeria arxii CBS 175.79]